MYKDKKDLMDVKLLEGPIYLKNQLARQDVSMASQEYMGSFSVHFPNINKVNSYDVYVDTTRLLELVTSPHQGASRLLATKRTAEFTVFRKDEVWGCWSSGIYNSSLYRKTSHENGILLGILLAWKNYEKVIARKMDLDKNPIDEVFPS